MEDKACLVKHHHRRIQQTMFVFLHPLHDELHGSTFLKKLLPVNLDIIFLLSM